MLVEFLYIATAGCLAYSILAGFLIFRQLKVLKLHLSE